jgi:hypothetical protein
VDLGRTGANVIELAHARDDADLPLAQTGVELLLDLRGDDHVDALAERLGAAGYPVRVGVGCAADRLPAAHVVSGGDLRPGGHVGVAAPVRGDGRAADQYDDTARANQ